MSTKTLILTRDFMPHKVVSWDRAITMLFQGKIRVVEEYVGDEHIVGVIEPKRHRDFRQVIQALGGRQPDEVVQIRTPSVATLSGSIGSVKRGVKFSRINVFTRDGFKCQYCGSPKSPGALNYDHVVPRYKGGKTTWDNIVTCCYTCNSKKANRTPEEAGMTLRRHPVKPKTLPLIGPRFDLKEIPVNWIQYVSTYSLDESAVA